MPMLRSTIPVTTSLISLHADHIKSLKCPACQVPMELHQPDSGFPERMLWTCHHCRTWFLMDLIPEKDEAILVCLPDGTYFHSALD